MAWLRGGIVYPFAYCARILSAAFEVLGARYRLLTPITIAAIAANRANYLCQSAILNEGHRVSFFQLTHSLSDRI